MHFKLIIVMVEDRHTSEILAAAREAGATGAARTPFLLDAVATASNGRTLQANLLLLRNNAILAASLATNFAR